MKVYKGMKKNAVISDYYRNLKINAGNEEIQYQAFKVRQPDT